MSAILKPFMALYTAMLLLAMSLGLLATFLSLRLTHEGYSTQITGLILTSYFLGCIVGTLYSNRLIKVVGHIRSFAAFAAVYTAMVMLHGCIMSAAAWAVFRFFSGVAAIGLFMVIESWLNECSESNTRGRVFSIYMVMTYLGSSTGQQFLNIGDIGGQTLFFVVGFLMVLCIIPISLTRSIHPETICFEPMPLKNIVKKAPMGMLGCFTSGLLTSSFYTMAPVFCHGIKLDVSMISLFMTVTVLGGLLIQWPIGLLSDRVDRSKVIPCILALVALISTVIILGGNDRVGILIAATGFFGGFMFSIYPVSTARAYDLFEPKDVINVSSALLLFYGIGSALGPVGASSAMTLINGPYGYYIYCSGVCVVSAAISIYLRFRELAPVIPVEEQVDYIIMKHASPVATHIDPRSDINDENANTGQKENG